jgi:hypothetical protein
MRPETRLALAGAGGYLLGRTRKMRWALALGALLVARRSGSDRAGPLHRLVESSPETSKLAGDVRAFVGAASKAAAKKTLDKRVDDLSEMLHQRAERLRGEEPAEEAEEDSEEEVEEERPSASSDVGKGQSPRRPKPRRSAS